MGVPHFPILVTGPEGLHPSFAWMHTLKITPASPLWLNREWTEHDLTGGNWHPSASQLEEFRSRTQWAIFYSYVAAGFAESPKHFHHDDLDCLPPNLQDYKMRKSTNHQGQHVWQCDGPWAKVRFVHLPKVRRNSKYRYADEVSLDLNSSKIQVVIHRRYAARAVSEIPLSTVPVFIEKSDDFERDRNRFLNPFKIFNSTFRDDVGGYIQYAPRWTRQPQNYAPLPYGSGLSLPRVNLDVLTDSQSLQFIREAYTNFPTMDKDPYGIVDHIIKTTDGAFRLMQSMKLAAGR